jgi:carbonic anhydrase/acetyltransferase-like protein (isoleucine patch superfamily)
MPVLVRQLYCRTRNNNLEEGAAVQLPPQPVIGPTELPRMHAYLLRTGRTIAPFHRPAGEMKIHGRSLRQHQEEVLRAAGCNVEPIDDLQAVRSSPCLLVHDDLYFTYHAIVGFLNAAEKQRGMVSNARAALATSDLTERFVPAFQGAEVRVSDEEAYRVYDCYYLESLRPDEPLEGQTRLVPVPYTLKRMRSRANRYFEPSGRFSIPIARTFMTPIQHWANLVTANLLGMPDFFLHVLRQRPLLAASLPFRAAWRAGSLRPTRMLGKFYVAGRRCRTAPSAHIECAVLGRRVKIGPNAVIRGAVIGDEAEIGPGAIIEGCTLGDRVTIDGGITLRCCVADDEASLGAFFNQMSVFGRSSVLCPDSGIYDFQFKGSVRVTHKGHSVPSGSRLLGGCLGDRAFIGPDVHLVCGQEVPNDCVLVQSPRALVRDVENLPETVVRMDRAGRDKQRALRRAS